VRTPAFAAAALLALATTASAAPVDIPNALVILQDLTPLRADQVAEAAPPRFVLLEDGTVFVGGLRRVAAGRLDSAEMKAMERRLEEIRKLPLLTGSMSLGTGPQRYRLVLRKGRPFDAQLSGDPATAPASLQPLASLVAQLLRFVHPSLHPWTPTVYAMQAREGELRGGCRTWRGKEPVSGAVFAPRATPAADVADWPTGATPASVCMGDKRYVVAFRPILPGER
jgi:hypothetical protein